MPEERSLEEQVVAQVLQLGLSSQVDSAEAVNVEVRTDLPQVVQGQVNALAVSGQGMVIQDIRMQELEVQTDRISVNLLSALLGKLELDHPVNASARITFTEADLNQTINADQVVQMMRPLELEVEGEIVQVEL
jgi:ubiquinone biosynthesis protein UbiJ